ncbi:MAG: hypothetical protein ACR2HR_05200 [Euzebya sp.]
MLFFVEDTSGTAPLGTAGRVHVRSLRSSREKPPWKDLPSSTGSVERQFVRKVHLGSTLLPFRLLPPVAAVIPHDGTKVLDGTDARLDRYPGLAQWWRAVESQWMANRPSDRLALVEQLDYMSKLTRQLPAGSHRVLYTKAGAHLAAARIDDPTVIIDTNLYWGTTTTIAEARYLTAILNAPVLTELVQPLQARGLFGPRHFDKYVWKLPIPIYNANIEVHQQLVDLVSQAEQLVADFDLPDSGFQHQRRKVRDLLAASEVGIAINHRVTTLMTNGA